MKLLKIQATHYKNCKDNFSIDFVSKARKISEDKEYELQEVAENLDVYNTVAFVGKNASGKTTAIELLNDCYSILGNFSLENKYYDYNNVELKIYFFYEGIIYRYETTLKADTTFGNKVTFTNQHIYEKKYYKTKINNLYKDSDFKEIQNLGELPEDTSSVFFILKKKKNHAVYFNSYGEGINTYSMIFKTMKKYNISNDILINIIKLFDENITTLKMLDEHNYFISYDNTEKILSDKELLYMLSSGTTKGILLYIMMVASLQNGFDLIIDEIENHFHKTLVENMISLYKDKLVNRSNARLIFTTHYCEILDLFNRQDNIFITKAEPQVNIYNMFDDYNLKNNLLKSKQFYNNTFQTSVNYNELMNLKRKLML